MGVNGLLQLLAPIQKRRHLSEFRGKRIAIDGFVWLHRAAFRYCVELCKDPSTPLLLPYLMSRINALKTCGIVPVVIFDGQSLPSKLMTNQKRRKEREENLEKAKMLESMGRITDAFPFYQKAVSIRSSTAWVWIKELQKACVEYIVSPYEADAQLAYLVRTGYVDAVITEDSDLIAYRSPLTLFKLDDSLHVVSVSYDDALEYSGLSPDNFTALCIFAGCDYSDHIGKLGIKTALKFLKEFGSVDGVINAALDNPKYTVPETFREDFQKAFTTFLCARAFDPRTEVLVNLSQPPEEQDNEFLGRALDHDLLLQLVKGKIDTVTLQPFELPSSGSKYSPYFQNKVETDPSSSPVAKNEIKWAAKSKKPEREVKKSSNSKHFIAYEQWEDPRKPQPRITSYFQLDHSSKLK